MSKKIASWEHPYQTNALNASIEKKKKDPRKTSGSQDSF